jgi:hypothetical protein
MNNLQFRIVSEKLTNALISYALKDSPFVWSSLDSMDTGTGVPCRTPASYVAACSTSIYTTFHT